MSGQLNDGSSSGGACPLVSVWKVLGGYGGGGASCGPGGGGGAGYYGIVQFRFLKKVEKNLLMKIEARIDYFVAN